MITSQSSSSSLNGGTRTSSTCSTSKADSLKSYDYGGTGSGGYQSGGAVGGSEYYNSAEFKSQTEDYFARKQQENASRPADLPPSQGGKYSGFGYTPEAAPKRSQTMDFGTVKDEAFSSLASSLSMLSMGAARFASKATENATRWGSAASQKITELKVSEKLSDLGVDSVGQKISELGKRGVSGISGLWSTVGGGFESVGGTNNSAGFGSGSGESSSLLRGSQSAGNLEGMSYQHQQDDSQNGGGQANNWGSGHGDSYQGYQTIGQDAAADSTIGSVEELRSRVERKKREVRQERSTKREVKQKEPAPKNPEDDLWENL
ncbi:unnamed protein product [Cyprideis torosa]|uniref:Uncharacterized protein n=1 Tax=Cyprideis torosa TaxID=163714 RepID=A0A7R8ZLG3_9CRUS|nr:unnamed protein product [Cyprideis torosa]CAG0891760.1 unnamed protein product [Cyprideis torosa]